MRFAAWGLVYLALAGVGFAVMNWILAEPPIPEREAVPVNLEFPLGKSAVQQGVLASGWASRGKVAWVKQQSAVLNLPLDGRADGGVSLYIEAIAKETTAAPVEVNLLFNGDRIGNWPVPAGATKQRWFSVSNASFNKSQTGKLEIRLASNAPVSESLGLTQVKLLDADQLQDIKGSIDHCGSERIVGWATAGAEPLDVKVVQDGRPVAGRMQATERTDLPRHGYANDAGFEFVPTSPLRQGVAELHYAEGRQVLRLQCKIE